MKLHTGLDIGSTTCKVVVLDDNDNILYREYTRHHSDIKKTVIEIIGRCKDRFKYDSTTFAITGSGGLSVYKLLGSDFFQEVVASTEAINRFIPETDVAIELGGEDSKITYLKGSIEQRMNSICAGGTGSFIDQMASLLETNASGLNEYAKSYEKKYPIASRCGVFAKTDVQALVNQGATKEDIAASVFQSVVNQTISNLACGRPIRGKVAFLGGPLHFLPELRKRFIETLELSEDEVIVPENPEVFVALGTAILSRDGKVTNFIELYDKLINSKTEVEKESTFLEPLFNSEEELKAFKERHNKDEVETYPLKGYHGPLYLGIDAGSTTSKIVLLDKDSNIRYSFYGNNKGKPLDVVVEKIKEIYSEMEDDAVIINSGITGYGEDFIKAAIGVDLGEVETIAHLKAAMFYDPNVDFIVDIGGQDMKAMQVEDGVISSILLNEACSSGCGSFLETFANSIDLSVSEFTDKALYSENPVDLGSRCTVFMNSRVKQAQKEGAEVADIAAGLSYSIIKNAIQKVIKIRDPELLGDNIVVQGGTFYGDSVLRSFEKITGKEVKRPKIAGLMGAFGMALIAKEKADEERKTVSNLLSTEELDAFSYEVRKTNCRQCTNNCALSINLFPNGERFITGNRCERGAGVVRAKGSEIPNMFDYKYKRVFDYDSLPLENAPRGEVGILRVLNMYENYPFWHTFFTDLGYRVVLSSESTREIYEKGIDSIASETACYPAKISHGHMEDLIDRGIKFIFHPSVFYEEKEFSSSQNNLNCPVVAGYSEVLKNNVESIKEQNVKFLNPFMSFNDRKKLEKRMAEVFPEIPVREIKHAVRVAYEEQDRFTEDIIEEGKRAIDWVNTNNKKAIVLSGRPYHIDPEINHGIAELITSMDLAVLTEDSVAYYNDVQGKLRVLDQWAYHSRLYRAAEFVGATDNYELLQLNSFGCGLDAVTTDQVKEILDSFNKIYTVIKIDEVSNLGAVKIRIRSLIEASERRKKETPNHEIKSYVDKPLLYTKEMAKDGYTVLIPQMLKMHLGIFESALQSAGMNVEILHTVTSSSVDEGLKYVNNDACYPSMFVVGQFIDALKSGEYNPDKVALLMPQTGGACRASNYVGFIRKALKESGFEQVPVIGISMQGIESHPGLTFGLNYTKLIKPIIASFIYGDLLMRLSNATRPYEAIKGSTAILDNRWMEICKKSVSNFNRREYEENIKNMVNEYSNLEILDIKKPKVGIVGEILVKYLEEANNDLRDFLEEEGAEVVINDVIDFFYYCMRNTLIKNQKLSKKLLPAIGAEKLIDYIESYRKPVREALENTRFTNLSDINEIAEFAEEFVDLGNQYGEGWLLTGEMVELIHHGANNIVCVQPFGCLPNHIVGKGVMKSVKEKYDNANIVAIDYDASASMTNQHNRLKLMMSRAKKQVDEDRKYSEKLMRERQNKAVSANR